MSVPSLSEEYVLSADYEERVYAGVLGKIIGVYLGRPFEQWTNRRIEAELGEIHYYVHDRMNVPLIVADDDISGTFTFVRALQANGNRVGISSKEIGEWWLNTIIDGRTILWWGGVGISTEHTAYARLRAGIEAPLSGSARTNGAVVAEQIGAQIFIDGWSMVAPGDPVLASTFARQAASVSHDGEAVYGAMAIAAMEAQAFVEPDIDVLLDTALRLIPGASLISEVIRDVRKWADADTDDWRSTLGKITEKYGYQRYVGGCHVVPNHAVVILGLIHGRDDFQRGMMVTNTAGYDTDCNSGNVACLLAIKNGLRVFDSGRDWRGPVADRLYLPTAIGSKTVTDALTESYALINMARGLIGAPDFKPKGGARFHFSLPGSVQGFRREDGFGETLLIGNRSGRLAISIKGLRLNCPARFSTPTFLPKNDMAEGGYGMAASPTLYSGQILKADIKGDSDLVGEARIAPYIRVYGKRDELETIRGEPVPIVTGGSSAIVWTVPDTHRYPIAEAGLEISSDSTINGTILLDRLTWDGPPNVILGRPDGDHVGQAWQKAWVNAVSLFPDGASVLAGGVRVVQNEGTGLAITGDERWTGFTLETEIVTHLAARIGILVCVNGLRRYVALLLDSDGCVRLVEQRDFRCRVLAEFPARWDYEERYSVSLTVLDEEILATFAGHALTVRDEELQRTGAVGLLIDTGNFEAGPIRISPCANAVEKLG